MGGGDVVYRETVAWTRVVVVRPGTGAVGGGEPRPAGGRVEAGGGAAVGHVLAAAGAGALLVVAARAAARAIGAGGARRPRPLGPGGGGETVVALPERTG